MKILSLLLQLSDSALPTGGFSHSFGFEQYLFRREVHDAETFSQWLRAYTATQLTYTDALLMRMLFEGVDEHELADRTLAATMPAQVRQADIAIAKRIRKIGEDALGMPNTNVECAHPALEFARITRHFEVPREKAILAHLTSSVMSLTQNAVRSIPIGQSEGQRVIADLLLSSQGATRIYKTPHEPAVQQMAISLGARSRLEYIPDQVIAYKDADYRQHTTITIAPDAQGFFADIVTPGWDPEDVGFTYSGMHLRTEVQADTGSGLVCVDNVRIRPRALGQAISGIGYLEGATHMGSILILGRHTQGEYLDTVREIVQSQGSAKAGITSGSRHSVSWVMVRALGESTDGLYKMILDVNAYDRSVTTGQERLNLRRY